MEVALGVVSNTTSTAIVRVVGGQTYLDECSDKGIVMPGNRSVIVEGTGNGTRDMPIIDCQRKGRLFSFGDPSYPPTLQAATQLEGLGMMHSDALGSPFCVRAQESLHHLITLTCTEPGATIATIGSAWYDAFTDKCLPLLLAGACAKPVLPAYVDATCLNQSTCNMYLDLNRMQRW